MMAMKLVYLANVVVAGWIGISSMFFPKISSQTIFSNAYPTTEIIRLTGCLWLAIALLSCLGIWRPITFSPVFLLQLFYKTCWILTVALPAIKNDEPYPATMAIFFVVWIMVLPFVIPWLAWTK